MAHIKSMVMQGFKSFAKRTEVPFDKNINLFIGANGSGKSNVAEALCFVLGRLSAKSMRAAKAKNLIFMGSKFVKPAKEASVELIFNNADGSFSIEKDEVVLKRIVRAKGASVYKINGETKTRGEVIEMLAQAGIDPYGFNLVMQGQIQSIVKMHSDDRRKIIEEVAGISIYETRKEKSKKELDKTEERLKEIGTILKERTAYLRNLEKEKAQAQRFKDAELTVKRAKASILNKKKSEKGKEVEGIKKNIADKDRLRVNGRERIDSLKKELEDLGDKIEEINKQVQRASGVEQDSLQENITNLKAELEGLRVRRESYENKQVEVERRIEELQGGIPEMEEEIEDLRGKSPGMAKKVKELRKRKEELGEIEKERKRLFGLKQELEGLKDRLMDKEKNKAKIGADSAAIIERLEELGGNLRHSGEEQCIGAIEGLRRSLGVKRDSLVDLHAKELKHEKLISVSDAVIGKAKEIKMKVEDIDVCPVCQSKITNKHKEHVHGDADLQIDDAVDKKEKAINEVERAKKLREEMGNEISKIEAELGEREKELVSHRHISEKKRELKKIVDEEKILDEEILALGKRREKLENVSLDMGKIEERYDKKMLDIEEISSRTEEDLDTTLLYKERELENMRNIVKRSGGDLEEIESGVLDISESIRDKEGELEGLEGKEKEMQARFKKLFDSRDGLQKEIQEKNLEMSDYANELRGVEDQVNYLKIGKAKLDAEYEALEMELSDFVGIELIQGSMQILEEKLRKSKDIVQNIGAINLRALEVFEQVKEEYDKVYTRVETLEKEKDDILKIIDEIDKKKKKSFMKTFKAINDLFSANFNKLSTKGTAYLDIASKEDIFSGGVDIAVKLAKGKYFDVTSLSGGEQTLVALSLLFAIQEHKPYHFYIFDEIDAALDKRNSERLAGLINQYMKSGQYIVITHNDAIISGSNVLYGVSMHEGVSKILSLKV